MMENEKAKIHGLTIDPVKGRIMIFRNTLAVLDYPEYFRFLLNKNKKKLAIQTCLMSDPGAEKLPEIENGDCCYIHSSDLVRYIYKICKWNPIYSNRVNGIYFPRIKTIEYDLNDPYELHFRMDSDNQ